MLSASVPRLDAGLLAGASVPPCSEASASSSEFSGVVDVAVSAFTDGGADILVGAPSPSFPDAGAPALVPDRSAASWSAFAHTSVPSDRVVQISCVCTSSAKNSLMPLVAS